MVGKKQKRKPSREGLNAASMEAGSDLIALSDRLIPHDGKEEYADLREEVISSRGFIDRGRWQLAKALYQVHDRAIWENWGYLSWDEYVDSEVGMVVRTTQYLMAMYHCFYIDLGRGMTPEEKERIMERVSAIGWTKARALVGVVNADNLDEWLEMARNMSSTELESATKKALLEQEGKDSSGVEKMKNLAMRLSEDQFEIWEQAFELGKGIADSEKKGHVFSMICQDFVATTMAQKGIPAERRQRYIDRIGAILGLRFIAIDKETGKVVHGEKLAEDLPK